MIEGIGLIVYPVADLAQASLQSFLAAGAQSLQESKDLGNSKQIATVKDTDGNIFGLIQLS